MSFQLFRNEKGTGMIVVLTLVLAMVIAAVAYGAMLNSGHGPAVESPASAPDPRTVLLQQGDGSGPGKQPFSFAKVPVWLLLHMGVIASLQILSLLWAALRANERVMTRRDGKLILFLCEVPMYLGLFGTLLAVSLTQVVTGSLVAPLAYVTTMSGVILHVIGKLGIWLRLPEELIEDEV